MSQPTTPPIPPINPYDVPEPRRPGMSGTSKVLLGLGVGCGVMLILCCGMLGFSGYAFVRLAKNSTVRDPRQIEDILNEIVTIEVPETLKPKIGLNVNLPVVGPFLKGVMYQDGGKKSILIVGRLNPSSFVDRDSFETQFRNSLEEPDSEDIEISHSEPFDSKIHDEPAHFTIARGMGRESHEECWEVLGHFQATDGPAIFIFKARTADFTQDEVMDMLKSMN